MGSGEKEISARVIAAFRRFLQLLPHGKDRELLVLKAHLLIEEQIRTLISEQLKNPIALKKAKLSCHHCICLAQSFFPPDFQPWIWDAARELNGIRNEIAHNIELDALDERIERFVQAYPSGFHDLEDRAGRFDLTLWSLFTAIADLVDSSSARATDSAIGIQVTTSTR